MTTKQELKEIFYTMFNKLKEIQEDSKFDETIEDCRTRTYKSKDNNFFFTKIVELVFDSGMRDWVIRKKIEGIRKAFPNFRTVASFGEDKVKELLNNEEIIRHERKIRALIHNAQEITKLVQEYGSFEKYLDSFQGDSIRLKKDMKKRFKYLGETNLYAFQKYVGFSTLGSVKNDVNVRRILSRLGLISSSKAKPEEVFKICQEMSEAVGENLNVVDEIFWSYGSGFNMKDHKAICGTKPLCSECPLTKVCRKTSKSNTKVSSAEYDVR